MLEATDQMVADPCSYIMQRFPPVCNGNESRLPHPETLGAFGKARHCSVHVGRSRLEPSDVTED